MIAAGSGVGGGVGIGIPGGTVTAGGLVPTARALIDAEYTERTVREVRDPNAKPPPLELEGLTAGALADLSNVTKDSMRGMGEGGAGLGGGIDSGAETEPYAPLEPYKLPVMAKAPQIEAGRVEIRLMALYDKLDKI